MLWKRTYKNHVTLPKKIVERFQDVEYFKAEAEDDRIVLTPVKMKPLKGCSLRKVREKISSLGISEKDIDDAVQWERKK